MSASRKLELHLLSNISSNKMFRFTTSENACSHGNKWMWGINVSIISMICIIIGYILAAYWVTLLGAVLMLIGLSIIGLYCVVTHSCNRTVYDVVFDRRQQIVLIKRNGRNLYSVEYESFVQLWFEQTEGEYCILVWYMFWSICYLIWAITTDCSQGYYQGGVVYIIIKDADESIRINSGLAIGEEIQAAKRMVEEANRYFTIDRENDRLKAV
eukprot:223704_1